jgi:hypothetical protein
MEVQQKNTTKKFMKPAIELYISTVRLLTIMDQVDMPNNGFKKAIRSIEDWAAKQSYILEDMDPEAHERIIHNFNVIMDSIDHEVLSTPIGELTVEAN